MGCCMGWCMSWHVGWRMGWRMGWPGRSRASPLLPRSACSQLPARVCVRIHAPVHHPTVCLSTFPSIHQWFLASMCARACMCMHVYACVCMCVHVCASVCVCVRDCAFAHPCSQAWAWMEWKEGQADVARSLYKRAADIDSVSPNAARVFQVGRWGRGTVQLGRKGKTGSWRMSGWM